MRSQELPDEHAKRSHNGFNQRQPAFFPVSSDVACLVVDQSHSILLLEGSWVVKANDMGNDLARIMAMAFV